LGEQALRVRQRPVVTEWDSLEGHEKGFRSSPPFYAMIKEMKHYSAKGTGKK
jgi:hypothetical protein